MIEGKPMPPVGKAGCHGRQGSILSPMMSASAAASQGMAGWAGGLLGPPGVSQQCCRLCLQRKPAAGHTTEQRPGGRKEEGQDSLGFPGSGLCTDPGHLRDTLYSPGSPGPRPLILEKGKRRLGPGGRSHRGG